MHTPLPSAGMAMSTPESKGGMAADLSFEMEDGGLESMLALGEVQEGVEFDDEAEIEYMAPTAYSESEICFDTGVIYSSADFFLSLLQWSPSRSLTRSRRRRPSENTSARYLRSSSGLPMTRMRFPLRSNSMRLPASGWRESDRTGRCVSRASVS